MGISHKAPNSAPLRLRQPYPEGLKEHWTRTLAARSEAGKSPETPD